MYIVHERLFDVKLIIHHEGTKKKATEEHIPKGQEGHRERKVKGINREFRRFRRFSGIFADYSGHRKAERARRNEDGRGFGWFFGNLFDWNGGLGIVVGIEGYGCWRNLIG